MATLIKSILIDAPPTKVWDVLFSDTYYRSWSQAFSESSYFVGTWQLDTLMQFMDKNGTGLLATVASAVPFQSLVLLHHRQIDPSKTVEVLTQEAEASGWAGAKEAYYLKSVLEGTNLEIQQDVTEEYAEIMTNMWDDALLRIKTLAEGVRPLEEIV